MAKGKLYGVGVGPGDPELLTLKAVKTLRACPVVACPVTGSGQMLALVLPECRQLGIHDVLVYCLAGNEASRKTILRCGGVYEATVSEPRSGKQLEQYRIHPD